MWPQAVAYFQTKSCKIVSYSVVQCRDFYVFVRRSDEGKGGCVRSFGHAHDSYQAENAENTDPCTNYAVKHATARGDLVFARDRIT